jgi:hypothetical protein
MASISSTESSSASAVAQKESALAYKITRISLVPLNRSKNRQKRRACRPVTPAINRPQPEINRASSPSDGSHRYPTCTPGGFRLSPNQRPEECRQAFCPKGSLGVLCSNLIGAAPVCDCYQANILRFCVLDRSRLESAGRKKNPLVRRGGLHSRPQQFDAFSLDRILVTLAFDKGEVAYPHRGKTDSNVERIFAVGSYNRFLMVRDVVLQICTLRIKRIPHEQLELFGRKLFRCRKFYHRVFRITWPTVVTTGQIWVQ